MVILTRSADVENLLDLDHADRTILSWVQQLLPSPLAGEGPGVRAMSSRQTGGFDSVAPREKRFTRIIHVGSRSRRPMVGLANRSTVAQRCVVKR
jgi:hypothetical protein